MKKNWNIPYLEILEINMTFGGKNGDNPPNPPTDTVCGTPAADNFSCPS